MTSSILWIFSAFDTIAPNSGIVFKTVPFVRFDSNLVHLFNSSAKGQKVLAETDASFSCYDVINFENFRKDRVWTSSK